MSRYYFLINIIIIIVFVISLTIAWKPSSLLKEKVLLKKRSISSNNHYQLRSQINKRRTIVTSIHDHFKSSYDWNHDNKIDQQHYQDSQAKHEQKKYIVVLTSLSGIYVWWPVIFGGDDSFQLLLSQEDVPRFHDVTGDKDGHIYLTAPHERTVYRLQYADGWWVSNFSNHSVMNSIRSEMPLFLNIHRISSILYVYGHTNIQIIDLLERPRTRGSAPFMKRLRELSPNLSISDLIIDQLTSDGYVIGDSYGWCTVIRCSLSVNECIFLFKIPSSYDNRPYSCTGTIDFSTKIMYLNLEEKILAIHLNEQTNYDRRYILTRKSGPRSTLGYDDIITHNNTILYTDVLRPLLHICTSIDSDSCSNVSLVFPSTQQIILPLRLGIIQVDNFHPPRVNYSDEIEINSNQSAMHSSPSSYLVQTTTTSFQYSITNTTTIVLKPIQKTDSNNIWMFLFGILIGLLLGGIAFLIYNILWSKNRSKIKKPFSSINSSLSSTNMIISSRISPTVFDSRKRNAAQNKLSNLSSSDSTTNCLLETATYPSTNDSNEWTTNTPSSLSYQPDIVL